MALLLLLWLFELSPKLPGLTLVVKTPVTIVGVPTKILRLAVLVLIQMLEESSIEEPELRVGLGADPGQIPVRPYFIAFSSSL